MALTWRDNSISLILLSKKAFSFWGGGEEAHARKIRGNNK
jgi:hypothetical protein